jgi:hypothetical protein
MEKRAPKDPERKTVPRELEEARLSPRRAFVVQFREGAADARIRFVGRVEHMVSGRATIFCCAEQMTRFMRRALETCESEPDQHRKNASRIATAGAGQLRRGSCLRGREKQKGMEGTKS